MLPVLVPVDVSKWFSRSGEQQSLVGQPHWPGMSTLASHQLQVYNTMVIKSQL